MTDVGVASPAEAATPAVPAVKAKRKTPSLKTVVKTQILTQRITATLQEHAEKKKLTRWTSMTSFEDQISPIFVFHPKSQFIAHWNMVLISGIAFYLVFIPFDVGMYY
jgi:hypothetical protein